MFGSISVLQQFPCFECLVTVVLLTIVYNRFSQWKVNTSIELLLSFPEPVCLVWFGLFGLAVCKYCDAPPPSTLSYTRFYFNYKTIVKGNRLMYNSVS